ncbi:hypothetical protein Q4S45_13915 [Massilia sp. R2A-15]|uniref:hypothetical protein n=1 Tax=Massilia sp. R2A-15 TaxID=3064278 RepID=UPI0027359756|nr:hypothetical protein [Massilia sp. R2A-15]WLI87833.1 hypothetical protein Q4S45_13915 [Massilia sp. R2A-15]
MKPVDLSGLETAIDNTLPTRKIALVRNLLPKITDARVRGLSKKEIWSSLHAAGLEMSYKMFVTYLARIQPAQPAPPTATATAAPPAATSRSEGGSTRAVLDEARRDLAAKDYAKVMRQRKPGNPT